MPSFATPGEGRRPKLVAKRLRTPRSWCRPPGQCLRLSVGKLGATRDAAASSVELHFGLSLILSCFLCCAGAFQYGSTMDARRTSARGAASQRHPFAAPPLRPELAAALVPGATFERTFTEQITYTATVEAVDRRPSATWVDVRWEEVEPGSGAGRERLQADSLAEDHIALTAQEDRHRRLAWFRTNTRSSGQRPSGETMRC